MLALLDTLRYDICILSMLVVTTLASAERMPSRNVFKGITVDSALPAGLSRRMIVSAFVFANVFA